MTFKPIESDFKAKFNAELRRYGCYVPSIAASMYIAGHPDCLIYNAVGNCFPYEGKVWRNQGAPTSPAQITGLLKGPQINVILHQIWPKNVYCPILAFDFHQRDVVWHCYKDLPVLKLLWKELALSYTTRKSLQS